MSEDLRVFIGFDAREAAAFHTCVQSIFEHTDAEIAIHRVGGLRRDGSNDFTFARYLVPYRCHFRGIAIFLDGDMLVRGDIAELAELVRLDRGLCVVKHPEYATKFSTKYLGAANRDYPRKNWGSVIVWNCGYYPNRVLTPDFVASADPMYLRQLRWLRDEQIGELPPAWNRLVLEQPLADDDKLRHFTIGAPCFAEFADCDGAEEWHETFSRTIAPLGGASAPSSFSTHDN